MFLKARQVIYMIEESVRASDHLANIYTQQHLVDLPWYGDSVESIKQFPDQETFCTLPDFTQLLYTCICTPHIAPTVKQPLCR